MTSITYGNASRCVQGSLERAGAVLLDRHFVYKSGKHGPGYINLDTIFPDVSLVSDFCVDLVHPYRGELLNPGQGIDTIAAPATGAIVLAVLAALETAQRFVKPIRAVWADKKGDDFHFERAGFVDQLTGKRVLVVEDLLTTGGSVAKVCREIERHGGEVVGVSAICNRGGVTAEQLKVPELHSVATVNFSAVDVLDCELCEQEVPIVTDIGHGKAFEEENPNYKGGFETLLS